MSELDFDELDKAVNTLMSGVPKVEPRKTDDGIKTLNINATLPDDAKPSLEKLDSTLSEMNAPKNESVASAPASTPAQPLASRRGGRFMDVVHPSSDMKNTLPRPTSRQGVTIEPTQRPATTPPVERPVVDSVVPPAQETAKRANETMVVSQTDPIPSEEHVAPVEKTPSGNDWPDPLDMTGYTTEPDTVKPDSQTEKSTAESPMVVDDAEEQSGDDELFTIETADEKEQPPLTTPFLADTKVDKRPLGGIAPSEPADEPGHAPVLGALASEDEPTDNVEDQLPATPNVTEAQLPPELHSDLMAIESDTDTIPVTPSDTQAGVSTPSLGDQASSTATTTPEVTAQPDEKNREKNTNQSAAPVAADEVAPVPAGPTSIPQQYREEPSTSDQESGAIYDTDSYHQPLAHPVKKKSGWLWIVWIVLLLAVGGGGAAALYFLDII